MRPICPRLSQDEPSSLWIVWSVGLCEQGHNIYTVQASQNDVHLSCFSSLYWCSSADGTFQNVMSKLHHWLNLSFVIVLLQGHLFLGIHIFISFKSQYICLEESWVDPKWRHFSSTFHGPFSKCALVCTCVLVFLVKCLLWAPSTVPKFTFQR